MNPVKPSPVRQAKLDALIHELGLITLHKDALENQTRSVYLRLQALEQTPDSELTTKKEEKSDDKG